MPQDAEFDPTDKGTLRPHNEPLTKKGDDYQPMELPDFAPKVHLPDYVSPDDPITIFLLYYTPELIKTIVESTNSYFREPENPSNIHARANGWYPTDKGEIYVFFAIRIYMTMYPINSMADYWNTDKMAPYHPITRYMSRNRFEELHMRYRVAKPSVTDIYEKVEPLSSHIQATNLALWKPGRDVAVDETMVRFTGRAYEVTTIPNKPTPTGLKVWVIAQNGFALSWRFHRPSKKNGPVGVTVPRLPKGKTINKTQAVVVDLLEGLPYAGYHVYMDNLFTSTNLFLYLRSHGFGATGTCRATSGVVQELAVFKKKDGGKDQLPWGTIKSYTDESNQVLQTGWKDNAFALAMTTVHNDQDMVTRLRKRPKETSSNAKTARKPFGDSPTKELDIPELYDKYNLKMGAVDTADQLQGHNGGFRRLKRGGIQALDHWLLRVVLVNSYLICLYSKTDAERQIDFKNQDDFRSQLIDSLLALSSSIRPDGKIPRKRTFAHMNSETVQVPVHRHEHIRMATRRNCVACKGVRYGDRIYKRVALAEIAVNKGRSSIRKTSSYGCKQCTVSLCKDGSCFRQYHQNL